MKTIFKYMLEADNLKVSMPVGAVILSAKNQSEEICLWAEVDTKNDEEIRTFEVYGTGQEMHTDMAVERRFIDTVLLDNGSLVLHVFERLN